MVAGAAVPDPQKMNPCWCTTFVNKAQHFTPLHWSVADGKAALCIKYLGKEGSDPYQGVPNDTYLSPLALALHPQQYRALLKDPKPCEEVVQVMQAATGRWKPTVKHLWPPSFNKMLLFLSWATPLEVDILTNVVGFLEREDAVIFRKGFDWGSVKQDAKTPMESRQRLLPPPRKRRRVLTTQPSGPDPL